MQVVCIDRKESIQSILPEHADQKYVTYTFAKVMFVGRGGSARPVPMVDGTFELSSGDKYDVGAWYDMALTKAEAPPPTTPEGWPKEA